MLTAVVGATTNLIVAFYRESLPIAWQTFTYAKAESLQRDGATVLFFGNPTYHPGGQLVRQRLDESPLRLASHRHVFVPLMRTYPNWNDPEIRNVWKRFGHTKRPVMLIFKPDGSIAQLEPLDTKAIEQQFTAQSPIPIIPSLAWGVTIVAFIAWRHSRNHKTEPKNAHERRIRVC
ncbi:hypothetical protein Mal33_50620 [Rosistilla oblonga]|uniref:Uncharacterized protein n=2 Tax=Rosistilla oblonga TaxID=2527990 RepID=A0A518J123_9BACT|nr:hypothetical protein Mal33_50620 [Rosistilla oblonga]